MNGPLLLAFDGLLAGLLVWLAWRALSVADLFKGIVLFIAFGLCMALAWVRLNAPDIALAEAAVGSGITGALLLAAWNRMRSVAADTGVVASTGRRGLPSGALAFGLACGGLGAVLGWAVRSLPLGGDGLAARALEALPRSGVTNPVTAALLNFRAYDTLLELGVLLLAVIAAWAMARADDPPADAPRGPVLLGLARVLTPPLVVLAAYFLWVGAARPGGAFQGGALLGGAGVLLLLARGGDLRLPPEIALRAVFVAGLAVFVAVGLGVATGPRRLLEYPVDLAGPLILVIETAAVVSIGATLAALFAGGRPSATPPGPPPGSGPRQEAS
ncbi:MAG: DUF4040 domain-containing protein [Acidobacteria bacterium]|nr:DUF4040 domain-containing protein [Acidobacteriota bacterium]